MRKTLSILLLVAGLALLGALPAAAGISGTAHDISGGTIVGGACAACHLPHGSTGEAGARLWVQDPSDYTDLAFVGAVAPLCGYCHWAAGGGNTGPAWSDDYVYGLLSHGRWMNTVTLPEGQVASGLPYMDDQNDGVIECTSCHNVHDDPTGTGGTGNAPFLQAGIDELCSGCHGNRRYETGTGWIEGSTALSAAMGAWGSSLGLTNPGSHPVGTDIQQDDTDTGGSPITIPNIMRVGTAAPAGGWTLGGHLTGGATTQGAGGVSCVTCHAVHGTQYDSLYISSGLATNGNDDVTPNENFLVVYQDGATLSGRFVANGQGDYNSLCEACHYSSSVVLDIGYGASTTDNPNPGGTSFGHPVDDMDVINPGNWVSSFPGGYPTGLGWAGVTPNPAVICSSCHGTHITADAARADNVNANVASSQYILRNAMGNICADCHTTSPGHHPVGIEFNSTGVDYLTNTGTGVGNSSATEVLDCATCHASGGAHNWTDAGAVGLDSAWVPADNARAVQYDGDLSKTCMDCHYNLNGSANYNPVLTSGPDAGISTEAAYELHGDGTHYIGKLDPRGNYTLGTDNDSYWLSTALGGAINPQTTSWDGIANGVAGGLSRFGGTGVGADTVLVCESCHELEPDKNNTNGTHLLLGEYTEQVNGSYTRNTEEFCEGCHLPAGTHPQYADTIGRTEGDPLNTSIDAVTRPWLANPGSGGPTMGDGATDEFTCDSCHQPHSAATEAVTFILDVDTSVAGTQLDNTTDAPVLAYGTNSDYSDTYANAYDDQTSMVVYQGFCNICHPYE